MAATLNPRNLISSHAEIPALIFSAMFGLVSASARSIGTMAFRVAVYSAVVILYWGWYWRCVLQLRGTYWMTLPLSIFILQKKEIIH
jgi:hypothetical protein